MYDAEKDRIVFLDWEEIILSVNNRMEGVGPVAFDLVKAVTFYTENLESNGLPFKWIDHFLDSYRLFCGDTFPDESHLVYFQMLEFTKRICLLYRNGMMDSGSAARYRELIENIYTGNSYWN